MDFFAPSPGAMPAPVNRSATTQADTSAPRCVLLVNDAPKVHEVTRLPLRTFEFQQRGLALLSANSATAAQPVFQ